MFPIYSNFDEFFVKMLKVEYTIHFLKKGKKL